MKPGLDPKRDPPVSSASTQTHLDALAQAAGTLARHRALLRRVEPPRPPMAEEVAEHLDSSGSVVE